MKLSAAKASAPGRKQVFRGPGCLDVIGLADEPLPAGSTPLLETLMRGGVRSTARGRLMDARRRVVADLAELPATARSIRSPHAVRPRVSKRLADLTHRVRRRIEREVLAPFGSHA